MGVKGREAQQAMVVYHGETFVGIFCFCSYCWGSSYWNLVEFLNWDVGLKVLGFWVSQGEEEVLSLHFGCIIYQFFLF
jgi:hypothetical protein